MEESLAALLARLHNEWQERISADEEAKQVRKESSIQIWIVWFDLQSGIAAQVRKELADQREKVKRIRKELKLADALVETIEVLSEVEAYTPPGGLGAETASDW